MIKTSQKVGIKGNNLNTLKAIYIYIYEKSTTNIILNDKNGIISSKSWNKARMSFINYSSLY